jgi:hypothetical protein
VGDPPATADAAALRPAGPAPAVLLTGDPGKPNLLPAAAAAAAPRRDAVAGLLPLLAAPRPVLTACLPAATPGTSRSRPLLASGDLSASPMAPMYSSSSSSVYPASLSCSPCTRWYNLPPPAAAPRPPASSNTTSRCLTPSPAYAAAAGTGVAGSASHPPPPAAAAGRYPSAIAPAPCPLRTPTPAAVGVLAALLACPTGVDRPLPPPLTP